MNAGNLKNKLKSRYWRAFGSDDYDRAKDLRGILEDKSVLAFREE